MAPVVQSVAPTATSPGSANAAPADGSVFQTWPTAKLTLNPGTGEIKAMFDGKMTVGLKGPEADALRAALGEERATRLKKKQELKDVSVDVESRGNLLRIKRIGST